MLFNMKFSLDDVQDKSLENVEKRRNMADGSVGNLPLNEKIDGSPIMNINNIKLHLNFTKPLEKLRNELNRLTKQNQGL